MIRWTVSPAAAPVVVATKCVPSLMRAHPPAHTSVQRDAVRDLDGRDCRGQRVRTEMSTGKGPSGGGGGGDRGGGDRGGGGGRGYDLAPDILP